MASLHHMSLAILFSSPSLADALRMIQNHETISRQRETSRRPTVAAFKVNRKKITLWNVARGEGGGVEGEGGFLSWKDASRVGSHVEKLHCVCFFFFLTCLHMTGPVSVRNKTALQLRRDVVMRPVSSCTSGRPGGFTTSPYDWMSPAAKTIQTLSASFSPGGRLSPDLFCSV